MPSRLEKPILTVDVGFLHKVDTRNDEVLFSMWNVFSRCAESVEDGRRLENLSWRLWNRETFCCEPGEANATTPAMYIAGVPNLSGSVDSLADRKAIEFDSEEANSTSATANISRPYLQRNNSSCVRSRGRERHITPNDLEKMVLTIKEKKDLAPLTLTLAPVAETPATELTPTAIAPAPTPVSVEVKPTNSNASSNTPPAINSDSPSGMSECSTTSVVRGFSPSHISSSYRSIPLLNAPSIPKSSLASNSCASLPKKHTIFALGGSSLSGDDSFEANSLKSQAKKKSNAFTFGGSSGEDESSLRENVDQSSLSEALHRPLENRKQASFKEELVTRTIHEDSVMDDDVFETDEDEIDESAIDDDDSDWEDSIEESGKSSFDEKTFFQRVDSRPNLTSRRPLITTMLHQNDRAAALANAASISTPAIQRSRTSSPQGPSLAASPDSGDGIPRSAAQPIIMTTTNVTPHQAALSPKTTRRNMLQTELTASLRRHLLWERQQKNQTATAVLKRRHTTHDISNLKQYPEKVHLGTDNGDSYESRNPYFWGEGDYYSKGW